MKEAEDFIEKFHNLEGNLLKEKKKSFFLLLDSQKLLNEKEDVLKEINEKLIPKTYLEEIYKLDLLIYFKRAFELFEILKSGNDIAASKIIRQPWFVPTIFQNVSSKEFVKNVFPYLSIVLRSKILKQILKHYKDEVFINSLFDDLLEEYGLTPALILLSGCSVNKIKDILKEREFNLSKAQLKLLYDKDDSLITFYYEEVHKKGRDNGKLKTFTDYLSKINPLLYMKLSSKYRLSGSTLGHRATMKYVSENKEDVIKNAQKYFKLGIFRTRTLVSAMGCDIPKFLKEIFPKKLSDLDNSHDVHNLLKFCPKKKRYEIYSNTFNQVYNKNLFSSKNFITEELLEVITSDEEREKWVKVFENDVKYIKYKRSSIAVPELKEHLLKCDAISRREELFMDLVTTCSISKDYNSLLDVLKLLCNRFRNTDASVFISCLNEIHYKIDLEELDETHWDCFYEILSILNVRDLEPHTLTVFEYCRFLYKSGKSFEDMIPIFFKSNSFQITNLRFTTKTFKDEKFHGDFLKFVVKHYSDRKENEDDMYISLEIVMGVEWWNKHHPNDIILVSEQKLIIESVRKSIGTNWIFYKSREMKSMKYLVCRENSFEAFKYIYFSRVNILENITMNKWLLKYKPDVFEDNFDKLIEINNMKNKCMFDIYEDNNDKLFEINNVKNKYFSKYLRKYEHNGLASKIIEYYMEKLKDSQGDSKEEIAELLASIMPKDDYLKLLETFVPTVDKLDLLIASEKDKLKLRIQNALAKSVRFSTCHKDALPIILKYCTDDTFHSVLHSLYSCFSHIPEDSLKSVQETLLKKPVSARKHVIFLAAMAFPIETYNELVQKLMKDDKNDSIQKHLFTSSYKYFLKNPLEPLWKVLQKYVRHLTLHEKETLILITNIHVIPEKYRGKIAEIIWEVFEHLELKEKKPMSKYYEKLMKRMADNDMKFLSSEFCLKVINTKFLRESYEKNNAYMNFAIKFMMYGADIKKNIQSVLGILKKYKTENWNDSKKSKYAKSVIYIFCRKIFDKTMNKRELRINLPKEFVVMLNEEWKRLFSLQDTFNEYLMLDFMILKYEESENLGVYAKKINDLFEDSIKYYNEEYIVALFKNILSSTLILMLGKLNYDNKLIKLLNNMIRENSSVPHCLLVISLLPESCDDAEFKTNFEYIVETLNSKSDVVQIYLNDYLKTSKYRD